ncbi:MAG: FHA domain-containing protein [Anaerolineae bacterium]|nr:FHA domain-containing protein [Anaerolineae bacterium]
MSVEMWYGSKPHHEAEQETLLELYDYLQSQQQHFSVLLNFFSGQSSEIDLMVLKPDGVFLAEVKHLWDPVFGEREGPWVVRRPDGTEMVLNPERPNPYKQVQRNYYSWKTWCLENQDALSPEHTGQLLPGAQAATEWAAVMTYVVCYPDLPSGSQLDIGDWPVRAVGLPRFLSSLVMRSSPKVTLSRCQMRRLPELLGLTQWQMATRTDRLSHWRPAPFAALVARGHACSAPVYRLDAAHAAEPSKERFTVGRDPDNDLVIVDPAVSRSHAEIFRRAGRWVVRDLGSTSGTFVSYEGDPDVESPVRDREFALKDNSIVRFGPAAYTLLIYEVTNGGEAPMHEAVVTLMGSGFDDRHKTVSGGGRP